MFDIPIPEYLFYALVAGTAALVVILISTQIALMLRKRAVNRRMSKLTQTTNSQAALASLLAERGLSATGNYSGPFIWLSRLYLQSGRTGNPATYAMIFVALGAVLSIVLIIFRVSLPSAVLVGLLFATLAPLLLLRRARSRRLKLIERQLPDALDIIVRSLGAGHPVPVAISLVGREAPDPVGTEFGIVADEISFGLDLESAVKKMAERVGFDGLHLLSVAVSIQSRSGGNLSEILSNLSATLRARFQLRLKVRSLASEGKMSAIILSAFPLVMFGVLLVIAPDYYGEVWGDPFIVPTFVAFGLLALVGDFIMYRMVNFDI